MNAEQKHFELNPIGSVQVDEEKGLFFLKIDELYREALNQLNQFSHVMVFWWADRMDAPQYRKVLTAQLPYAKDVKAGVFACRSEYRPNPIAVTTTMVLNVDLENGVVIVPWMDAFDGTPILDLKPYIPCTDRVRDVQVADWMSDWPDWMDDAGEYFA
ncbi:MAG: SAM-dependent methyltransferase [Anaerolineaceae bacterium]|nr:SAM-dependent methyltransferase [Anaerolineaceae bacterium]